LRDKECTKAIEAALGIGYRHIDTAQIYENEAEVGAGIKNSKIPRSDIFLTTKVWMDKLHDGDLQKSADESLKKLKTDYVDLLLIHWPNPAIALSETMPALARAKQQGLARHIGVANFNIALLDQAIALCPEPLVTLQAELHPYLDQSKLIAACRARGLVYTAYCPLGRGRILKDPVLGEIARRKGKTIAQVALRWLIQKDIVAPIPRSSNAARMAQNLDVFDFALSDDEMARIDALKRPDGRIANPAGRVPPWDV